MQQDRKIRFWLWIGLIMVFVQIMIGGITRLTDSGLSITDWELVEGVLPPLNEADWEAAFEKYKEHARAQYERLHIDMNLGEFQWIYFWEWIHRLWGRLLGLVFILPFLVFWWRGDLYPGLKRRLLLIIGLIGAAGVFGWVMVASGLNNDQRTWVNAYNLVLHLLLAGSTLAAIYWTILHESKTWEMIKQSTPVHRWAVALIVVFIFQIVLGGLMAGMRAGLLHPHWPFFINGGQLAEAFFSNALFSSAEWMDYEPSRSVKAFVQVGHRFLAYLLVLMILMVAWTLRKFSDFRVRGIVYGLLGVVALQFVLGVLTILESQGSIPLTYGVLHQLVAFVLLLYVLKLKFFFRPG